MLDKFLKEVVTIVVGKQAEPVADLLNSKKHVNEFLIAKKLDVTINQARNILYRLSNYGLVSSIRKKDKKKGWYTYFWKIEVLKSLEFLKQMIDKRIGEIENQVKSRETKQFYVCERCNIELNEETALLYDFTCNECGEIFKLRDNTKLLRDFNREKEKLNAELDKINEEIEKEESKLGKIRTRAHLKQEKEKKEAREKARLERKKKNAATKAANKKVVKKTAKKKLTKKKSVKKKTPKKKVVKKSVKKKTGKKK